MKIEQVSQSSLYGHVYGKIIDQESNNLRKSYDEVEEPRSHRHHEEEPVCLSTLVYTKLNPLSSKVDCTFFKRALKKQPSFDKIEFFHVEPNRDNTSTTSTVTSKAFIAVNECIGFISADHQVIQTNKESLATLLDLLDDYGCEKMYACVDRENPHMRNIVQSYMSIGFCLNNDVVFPGYIMLLQEF